MSDLSDEAIRAYAASVFDLEDDRDRVQADLKNVWSHIREAHGKRFADSLKLAVKRARMDTDKRTAADEVDAEAERLIGILNGHRAPRATRSASGMPITDHSPDAGNMVPEHDADGVIIERSGGAPDARLPPKQESAGSSPAQITNSAALELSPSDPQWSDAAIGNEVGARAADTEPDAALRPQTGGLKPLVDQSLGDGDTAIGTGNAVVGAVNGAVLLPTPQGAADGTAHRSVVTAGETATHPDHSKPNPWCLDPEECGLSSWTHFCGRCQRVKAERQSVSAVQ